MECESPASQAHNVARSQASYQQQQNWPEGHHSNSGHHGNSSHSHRHHSTHRHGSTSGVTHVAQSPPSLHAAVPPNMTVPQQGVLLGTGYNPTDQLVFSDPAGIRQGGLDLSTSLPVPTATYNNQHVHGSHSNIDPVGLNMQIPAYPSGYGPQWHGPGFPFSLSSNSGTGDVGPQQHGHGRTVSERSDDSPMIGVCVQQSPVASH